MDVHNRNYNSKSKVIAKKKKKKKVGVGGTFFFLADETSERIRLVEPCF